MLKFRANFGGASASFVEGFSFGARFFGFNGRRLPVTRPENKG
jgi:hypothetical protein